MVFHRSLGYNKSTQDSRTLLSVLADLNNTVVWMVSTRPVIFKSSSHYTNSLMTVPRTPITFGVTVTFMFHSLFDSLEQLWYLFLFSLSFNFENSTFRQFSLFYPCKICLSGKYEVINLYLKIAEKFVSHSPGQILDCGYIIR